MKKNAIVLLLVSFLVLFFVLKDDFDQIVKTLFTMNPMFLIIAVIGILLYIFFKSLALYSTVKNEVEGYTLWKAIKHNMITQFFNGITPFSTGGQPMEIYMLHQKGIRIPKATNLIMQTFIFYQVALVFFGIIAVVFNSMFSYFNVSSLLNGLILLGFSINTFVAILLFIVSFSKKSNAWLLKTGLNILTKLKIVKDKEKTYVAWRDRLDDFHESASHLKKNKGLFLKGVIYNFLGLVSYYIIPLWIAYSMGSYTSMNGLEAIVASAYVLIMASFVPIPGASGGIEYGFLSFFGNFIKGPMLSAMLLMWRFVTYYLPMILGAICFSLDKGDEVK